MQFTMRIEIMHCQSLYGSITTYRYKVPCGVSFFDGYFPTWALKFIQTIPGDLK